MWGLPGEKWKDKDKDWDKDKDKDKEKEKDEYEDEDKDKGHWVVTFSVNKAVEHQVFLHSLPHGARGSDYLLDHQVGILELCKI